MKKVQSHSDNECIERYKKGDIEAYTTLVERYKDVSLSLICSILKNVTYAEDILQDVFLSMYDQLHSFKFKSKFSVWLYRVVVNASYNALKKQKRNVSFSEISYEVLNTHETEEKDEFNQSEQKKYILLAMNNLKSDEALLLRLFYLCELSISEIEEITGFSKSKIKVVLHRGRQNIKIELHKLIGNELSGLI